LKAFDAVIQGSPICAPCWHPLPSPSRANVWSSAYRGSSRLERIIRNFLLVLTDHRRAGALSEVIDAFDLLLDERLGFVRRRLSRLTNSRRNSANSFL